MSIAVTCSGCHSNYNVPDSMGGKKAKCTKCGAVLLVPAVDSAAAPSTPTPAPNPSPTPTTTGTNSGGLDWNKLGMGSAAGSPASTPKPAAPSGGGLFDDLDPPGEYNVAPANSIDEALAMASSAPASYGGGKSSPLGVPYQGGGGLGARSGSSGSSMLSAIASTLLCLVGAGFMFLILLCSGNALLSLLIGALGFAAAIGCGVTGAMRKPMIAWAICGGFAFICLLGIGKVGLDVASGVNRAQANAQTHVNTFPPQHQPPPWHNPPVNPGFTPPSVPRQAPNPGGRNPGEGWKPPTEATSSPQARFEQWRVLADPLATWAAVGEGRELSITLTEPAWVPVLHGNGYSRALALQHRVGNQDVFEVWDLAARTKVGELVGRSEFQGDVALSPDGRFVAGVVRGEIGAQEQTLQVWSMETASLVRELPGPHKLARIEFLQFSAPESLVMIVAEGPSRKLKLWNVTDGAVIREQTLAQNLDAKKLTFSPGRKYLALVEREKMDVLELATGNLVGSFIPPSNWRVEAISFSPDGAEMVALVDGDFALHLYCWQTQSSTMTAQHKLADRKHDLLGFEDKTGGMPIGWLSKGEGWLVAGKKVISRKDGQVTWTLPNDLTKDLPAKVLDADMLLTLDKQPGREAIVTLQPFPFEMMDKVSQAVAAGGADIDAQLPSFGQGDWSQVKELTWRLGSPWSAKVGARPALKPGAANKTIPLSNDRVQRLLFSDPPAAQVVMLDVDARSPDHQDLSPTVVSHLTRIDLVSGESAAKIKVPGGSQLFAVSPSGERAVLLIGKDDARLDIYSLGEQPAHAGAWRPYADSKGDLELRSHNKEWSRRSVAWADFIDEDHLLTLSHVDGQLVLWKLPERKALYRLSTGARGSAALSPDRKYVVLQPQDRAVIIDAQTGSPAGEMLIPFTPINGPVASDSYDFSADGKRLSIVVREHGGLFLLAYDLTSGKSLGLTPLGTLVDRVQWCDERQLLASSGDRYANQLMLVDLDRKAIAWRYVVHGGYKLTHTPDQRIWMVAAAHKSPSALVAQPFVLTPEVKSAVGQLPLNPAPVFGPGSSVSIDTANVGGGISDGGLPNKVQAAWTAAIQRGGAQVAPSAKVRLVGSCSAGESRTEEYRLIQFGFRSNRSNENFSVTFTDYNLQVQLLDGSGAVLWEQKSQSRAYPPSSISSLPENASAAQYISDRVTEQHKRTIESFFSNCTLPYVIYPQPRDTNNQPGLGSSMINLASFAPTARPSVGRPEIGRPGTGRPGPAIAANALDAMQTLYTKALAENSNAASDHWQWCAGLERPVVAIRWGLGVQIEQPADKAKEQLQPKTVSPIVLREVERGAGPIGPFLVQMLRTKTSEGKFGTFVNIRDAELREVVFLGSGGRTQLAAAARKAGVDAVILIKLDKIERGRVRDASLTLEMLDLASTKKLWTSAVLLESKVTVAKREGQDLLKELANECGEVIDDKLKLAALDTMPSTTAVARAEAGTLHRTNPLASLAEVDIYLTRELITQPQAIAALTKLLGTTTNIPELVGTDVPARDAALEQVIPLLMKKLE